MATDAPGNKLPYDRYFAFLKQILFFHTPLLRESFGLVTNNGLETFLQTPWLCSHRIRESGSVLPRLFARSMVGSMQIAQKGTEGHGVFSGMHHLPLRPFVISDCSGLNASKLNIRPRYTQVTRIQSPSRITASHLEFIDFASEPANSCVRNEVNLPPISTAFLLFINSLAAKSR